MKTLGYPFQRSHSRSGATLVDVLDEYAEELARGGGRLYITGLDPELLKPLRSISKLTDDDDLVLYAATDRVGHSTREAVKDAKEWQPTG